VKIWVNEEDDKLLKRDKPVHLDDIEILEDMHNEVCLLEFEEQGIIILEFFRNNDKEYSEEIFDSLIFMSSSKLEDVSNLLKNNFSFSLYQDKLKPLADYEIHHKQHWQYWIERFLREKRISPNEKVINNRQFKVSKTRTLDYSSNNGLINDELKSKKEDILKLLYTIAR